MHNGLVTIIKMIKEIRIELFKELRKNDKKEFALKYEEKFHALTLSLEEIKKELEKILEEK